ncbi:MAG: undecaprenyl-diphosphate phosphatase [Pseudomonadota bacterium]
MHDIFLGIVLGIVEGITEFLPVSSTGHLIVAGELLDFTGNKASCFDVFIQLGAILAVMLLYRHRFLGLIPLPGNCGSSIAGFKGVRGIFLMSATTIPALIMGLIAHKTIKQHLFTPLTVALALGVGGIGILLAERYKPLSNTKSMDELTYRQAFVVGLFQCLALWPGMSRSASTIIGGLLSGLDRTTATEYSFLAAVPVMVAATGYDLMKAWPVLERSDALLFSTGFLVSFLSATIAVKTFIGLVQRWSLAPYAYYRLIIAPVIYFVMCS